MKTTRSWLAGAVAMVAVIGIAASCAPPAPGGGLATTNWSFKGTSVKVVESQDSVGICFRVEPVQGRAVPAQHRLPREDRRARFRPGLRGQPPHRRPGERRPRVRRSTSSGPQPSRRRRSAAVQALDLLDLANTNNHLEVVGTYVWASEEDQVGNGLAADGVAAVLEDALNETLASDPTNLANLDARLHRGPDPRTTSAMPSASSSRTFRCSDWATTCSAAACTSASVPPARSARRSTRWSVPLRSRRSTSRLDLPPSITGGGIYTLTGAKNYTQTFTGGGGQHIWNMQSGPA